MNVLVTGGAGYIGSHTVLELKERGHRTIVLDDLSRGRKELVFSDAFYPGNAGDSELISRICHTEKVDAVLHFAALIEAGESMRDPGSFFRNNVSHSANLLDALQKTGVTKFIFSSTAALFGIPDRTPIPEEALQKPINAYGESKKMVEQMLSWMDRIHGFRSVSLRYFNAAGADPQARSGELHDPETHLIPLALQTAYGMRDKIFIHGTDYDTPDGSCIRDFIHVSDLARAHVAALEYLEQGSETTAFNLGSEKGFSVREILQATREVVGHDFPVEEGPRRPGDPAILVASSRKIRETTGWSPRFTDPREIIETAHRFYRKYYGL